MYLIKSCNPISNGVDWEFVIVLNGNHDRIVWHNVVRVNTIDIVIVLNGNQDIARV